MFFNLFLSLNLHLYLFTIYWIFFFKNFSLFKIPIFVKSFIFFYIFQCLVLIHSEKFFKFPAIFKLHLCGSSLLPELCNSNTQAERKLFNSSCLCTLDSFVVVWWNIPANASGKMTHWHIFQHIFSSYSTPFSFI